MVVDIETTGLSRERHGITEIAAARVNCGRIIDKFHTMVDPGTSIPSYITSLTGITDEMVRGAPRIEQVLPSFLDFLGDQIFVAHNASFDYGFLSHKLLCHHDKWLKNQRLCTRKLANRLLPELPSKKLSALCAHFQIINIQAHRAMADVLATTELFNRFRIMLEGRGIVASDDILCFEKSAIAQASRMLL